MTDTKQQTSVRDVLPIPRDQFNYLEREYHRLSAKCKKQDHQLKAFANLSEVVNRQENELNVYKKRAQQFQSSYIASEAKLGHILKTWINSSQQKEGHVLDVEFIENLLQLKTEDLYSTQYQYDWLGRPKTKQDSTVDKCDLVEDGDSIVKNKDTDRQKHDLEEDGDLLGEQTDVIRVKAVETLSKPTYLETDSFKGNDNTQSKKNVNSTGGECLFMTQGLNLDTDCDSSPPRHKGITTETNVELLKAKTFSSGKVNTEVLKKTKNTHLTLKIDNIHTSPSKIGKAACSNISKSNLTEEYGVTVDYQNSPYSNEVIDKLVQDKEQLLNVIKQFKEETPEGWKAFTENKQYENLIKNLRLEVASCRIQNSEIKMLLLAKQSENVDALTKQIHNLYKELSKLNKQLTAKHALLHSLNTEYEKVKKEREDLLHQLCDTGKTGVIIKSENESETGKTSIEPNQHKGVHIDSEEWRAQFEKLQSNTNSQQKEITEMKHIIERLRSEKEKIIEQSEEYNSIIEDMKKERTNVVDESAPDVNFVQLKEQNERLKADVATYKHELETKKKDDAIIEAQIRLYQDDFRKEIEERKKERQENEKEKSQLLNLVKSMEIKYNKCLEELNPLREQHRTCQQNLMQLQSQFNNVMKQLEEETKKNIDLKYQVQSRQMSTGRCYLPTSKPLYQSPQYACLDIAVDGPEDDSPSSSPGYYQQTQNRASSQSAPGKLIGAKSIDDRRIIPGSAVDDRVVKNEMSNSNKLVCPQCYREFKPGESEKYRDHCKKCVM